MPIGRREWAKQDKRECIRAGARELFAEHGVRGVTTQQVADRADIAIGTLYLYASTKAELLIMVQNQKLAATIDAGLAAAAVTAARQGRHVRPVSANRGPRMPTCRQCSQSSHMCRLRAVR
jgi:AcrR family transcriptional regulator